MKIEGGLVKWKLWPQLPPPPAIKAIGNGTFKNWRTSFINSELKKTSQLSLTIQNSNQHKILMNKYGIYWNAFSWADGIVRYSGIRMSRMASVTLSTDSLSTKMEKFTRLGGSSNAWIYEFNGIKVSGFSYVFYLEMEGENSTRKGKAC